MSIRTWLDPYPQQFRSTSPDIGYRSVRYANGVYVAVGHQKAVPLWAGGWPSGYPTAGNPVSAAGCSWSADGLNWTDSRLPFTGTSMAYLDAQYDSVGRWMAGSCEYVQNSRKTYITFSTDNAKTWATPTLYNGEEMYALHGSYGKHFMVATNNVSTLTERRYGGGVLAASLPLASGATWSGSAASISVVDYIVFISFGVPRIWSSGAYLTPSGWTGWWTTAGVNLLDASTVYRPYDCVSTPTAFYALVSDQPNGPGGANQRGRDIWQSAAGGGNWTKVATLPYIAGGIKGPYYQLAYARTLGMLAAVGDGIMCVSRNGTNWTEVAIPSGAWRGVASDGTDFVLVSANGDRLKISGVSLGGRI